MNLYKTLKTCVLTVMLMALFTLPVSAATVTVTFLSGGAIPYAGYQTGFGQLAIGESEFLAICMEIGQYITPGQTYQAALTPVEGNPLLMSMAWLAEQALANPDQTGPIQFAIWYLGSPGSAPTTPESLAWVEASLKRAPVGSWFQVGHPDVQDQLTRTPEPETWAAGLVGLGVLSVRRWKGRKRASPTAVRGG